MTVEELQDFDDELKIMQELMEEPQIALSEADFEAPVGNLPLKKAVTVELGTPVKQCIDIMLARHIGCLVVVDKGKLAGMFTERDVLMKIAGSDTETTKVIVDKVMTPHPVALHVRDTIETVIRLMHGGRYRHVTIVDQSNRPVSVVSIKDIVAYIIDFFPQDILNLPPHPVRIGTKHREGA
jgi:CBS domain-containing protein